MLDPYWQQAWSAISPSLRPRERLLLPPGDWPKSDTSIRFYGPTIRVGDATLLVLHKGRLGAIGKNLLRGLRKRWEIVFANEVFVCFQKPGSPRLQPMPPCEDRHVAVIDAYLDSRNGKRIANSVYVLHLPKTAGTALWEALADGVASAIYYDSFETFRARPPLRDEYDLVGGHIPLPMLLRAAGPDAIVAGLFRDPVARLRSAFLHSRRPTEDPATFTTVMRALRERPLLDVLQTTDGQMEARQQLLMLGFDFRTVYTRDQDAAIFAAAVAHLDDPRCHIEATTRLDALAGELSRHLRRPPPCERIEVRNGSEEAASQADLAEFDAAMPAILDATAWDRRLHELIIDRSRPAPADHPAQG